MSCLVLREESEGKTRDLRKERWEKWSRAWDLRMRERKKNGKVEQVKEEESDRRRLAPTGVLSSLLFLSMRRVWDYTALCFQGTKDDEAALTQKKRLLYFSCPFPFLTCRAGRNQRKVLVLLPPFVLDCLPLERRSSQTLLSLVCLVCVWDFSSFHCSSSLFIFT